MTEIQPMRRHRGGFTLLEMMIVIAIIGIVLGVSVALFGIMMKGEAARKGGILVQQAVAETKQWAAKQHRYYFLVFSEEGKEGWMEIHEDKNNDGIYQGDQDPKTPDADKALDGYAIQLPRFVQFENAPKFVGFSPSGYLSFAPGFSEVQASTFDAVHNGSNPKPVGDIVIKIEHREFRMCLDLDKASGKVRRSHFLGEP